MVDQAFCSSWGDDALELLGDLAFQDGRFGEALAAYGRIVADHPDDPSALVHPDPSVDLARVAAKKLLCRAAAGEDPPGPADLERVSPALSRRDRELAGRNGVYADIVARGASSGPAGPAARAGQPLADLRRVVPADAKSSRCRSTWARCSGESTSRRSRSRRCRAFNPRTVMGGSPVSIAQERLLAFHPIVLGDQVIVCDGCGCWLST